VDRRLLERDHATQVDRARPLSGEIEAILLPVRFGPGRVHPREALRDQPPNPDGTSGEHQVLCPLGPDAGVPGQRLELAFAREPTRKSVS